MRFLERVTILFGAYGLISWRLHKPEGVLLLVIAIVSLAPLYLLGGAFLNNSIPGRAIFRKDSYADKQGWMLAVGAIAGLFQSLFILGLLFMVQHWPGAAILRSISVAASLAIVLVLALSKRTEKPLFSNLLIRAIGLAVFWVVVWVM